MIKNNKILLLVDKKPIVEELKEESNITFLFPIKDFCVGFHEYFQINDLPTDGYIFLNRILDQEGITNFKNMIKHLPSTVKGIVFDDIGILNILKREPINIPKILFLNHMNCNYESINAYLEDVDSVVVSTDITTEEIKTIQKQVHKPIVLFAFGHINIMYSRRTLLTNYQEHFKEKIEKIETITEISSKQPFKILENEYGTVIYTNEPFNGLRLIEEGPVLFYLINTIFLSIEEVKKILNRNDCLEQVYSYHYLSDKETIFKLKEREL